MNLEQCRYLDCIVQQGSINKASEVLNISHQALSKMVKKLEAEFGCTIFKRSGQGVALTVEGDKVWRFAQDFLLESRLLQEALERTKASSVSHLKILTTMVPHYSFLPDVVEVLMRNFPDVRIEMYHKNRIEIKRDLRQHGKECILAFLTEHSSAKGAYEDDLFSRQVLYHDKTYLVTGKNYPLTADKSVALEALRDKQFAIYQYDDAFDMLIFKWLEAARIPFQVVMKTDNLKLWENKLTASDTIGLSTRLLRQYDYFHVDEQKLLFYEIENYPEADIVMLAQNITDQKMLEQIRCRIPQNS